MSWDWEKLKEQQHKRGDIPPQVDDFLQTLSDKFKKPGGSLLVLIVLAVLYAGSGFYSVGVDEVGVVQRFGEYVRTEQPGLRYKWTGIEKFTKVKDKRIYKEEFGFHSFRSADKPTRVTSDSDTRGVSLMLTGDLNVAVVPWIVQYRISNPPHYLFNVEDVNRLLRDMSEAAMRLVVGDRSITEVINKREEIAEEAKILLQAELDKAETGIDIVTIEMKRTNVPKSVESSFNEVNQAIQEKEKMIYQAKEEYNKAIPAAMGEAERTIKAAEGYKLDRINRAQGDALRFKSVYEEYVKAKDVTRRRLYLESIKAVFPKLGQKYIVDANQKNLIPLLNLDKQNGVK